MAYKKTVSTSFHKYQSDDYRRSALPLRSSKNSIANYGFTPKIVAYVGFLRWISVWINPALSSMVFSSSGE